MYELHSLHVGWRNFFPVGLVCQFFLCCWKESRGISIKKWIVAVVAREPMLVTFCGDKMFHGLKVFIPAVSISIKTLTAQLLSPFWQGKNCSYILNFYVGIVHYILCETKTWCAKIYLPTQRTNRQILTSAKKVQFWLSTQVINTASFVNIASNSWQAEVIARSTRCQTLWTDKNLVRNHNTTKLVQKWMVTTIHSTYAVK